MPLACPYKVQKNRKMSITELSIKRPLLITVIFVTLILFGWITYKQLDYNLLPKFEANVISVQTTYRGASSDEVLGICRAVKSFPRSNDTLI